MKAFLILSLILSLPLFHSAKGAEKRIYSSAGEKFQLEIIAQQSDVVWGFDFLDNERILFSERGGALRILDLKTKSVSDIQGAPQVRSVGQGGLLDVRVHPREKSTIYLTYSEPKKNGVTTALARATLKGAKLVQMKKLFSADEPNSNRIHFGSRIEFDGDGHLWLSIGDRGERETAQDFSLHTGKVIRLNEDGSIPKDNPFTKRSGAKSEIWSVGHRSPQGLVLNKKTNELWLTEMGPRGGDELNLIRKGANYGWPVITYGREYHGPTIGEGTKKEGMEQPVAFWVPSISPSAMTFYTGNKFSNWQGHIFIAALSGMHLRRLKLNGQKVVDQEELLADLGARFRNVRTGPDGYLYLSTDDGKIARLVPRD